MCSGEMADNASLGPRLTVGLTGGIASGKSLVGGMFVKLGATLIDTDVVAREVVALGEPGLSAVSAAFGPRVLLPTSDLPLAIPPVRPTVKRGPRLALSAISPLHMRSGARMGARSIGD